MDCGWNQIDGEKKDAPEIVPITREEFEVLAGKGKKAGPPANPVVVRMRQLRVAEAFKAPCPWKHGRGRCHGSSIVADAAKRFGHQVHTLCREGWFYVLRVA